MFDRYVESEARPAAGRGRKLVIVGSVLAHVLAVAVLVGWSQYQVAELQEPAMFAGPITWRPDPPPTPPVKVTVVRGGTPQKPHRPQRDVFRQPPTTPKVDQPAPPTDADPSDAPGATDAPGSGGDGPPGSDGPGTCIGPDCQTSGGGLPLPAEPEKEIKKSAPPEPDQWLQKSPPALPEEVKLRLRGTSERWVAVLCAGVDGRIFRIKELHAIDGADDVIRAGVSRWRLKPQGVPICFPFVIEYTVE